MEEKSLLEMKLMADLLEDIQSSLEPMRDKALDEKARLTGYSQCAEAIVKFIADKAAAYKLQAVELAKKQHEEDVAKVSKVSKKTASKKAKS